MIIQYYNMQSMYSYLHKEFYNHGSYFAQCRMSTVDTIPNKYMCSIRQACHWRKETGVVEPTGCMKHLSKYKVYKK